MIFDDETVAMSQAVHHKDKAVRDAAWEKLQKIWQDKYASTSTPSNDDLRLPRPE